LNSSALTPCRRPAHGWRGHLLLSGMRRPWGAVASGAAAAVWAVAASLHASGAAAEATGAPNPNLWSAAEVFEMEGKLRQEVADLEAEASWLREPNGRFEWGQTAMMDRNSKLRRQVARTRQEVTWIHRTAAAENHAGAGVPLKGLGVPSDADHGRTLFVAMCAGTSYFDSFCGPFLASFERAYDAAALKHRVVIFTASVDPKMLQAAKSRFAPWVDFEPLPEEAGQDFAVADDNMVCEFEEGKITVCNAVANSVTGRQNKVVRNNVMLPVHIEAYLKRGKATEFCYVVIIDSDTLFVRPLGAFLPDCTAESGWQVDWEVGITVYDPDFHVPWAEDPAEAGRTSGGFSRINAGVVLISLAQPELALFFLHRWAQATSWLQSGGEEGLEEGEPWPDEAKRVWQDWGQTLLREFKGPNQASLALLLCSYETERLPELLGWGSACEACQRGVEVKLKIFPEEAETQLRMRALPARLLNHPESMRDGRFAPDLLVIHLKGMWWRNILPRGLTNLADSFRRSTWNRDSLALHWLLYDTWQLALPPEARHASLKALSPEDGREVSAEDLSKVLNGVSVNTRASRV